jgi:hypothetical protein
MSTTNTVSLYVGGQHKPHANTMISSLLAVASVARQYCAFIAGGRSPGAPVHYCAGECQLRPPAR